MIPNLNRLKYFSYKYIHFHILDLDYYPLILNAIEKVGNERGYDYILDSSRGGIVHALDSHKLDDYVLEELRKGSSPE